MPRVAAFDAHWGRCEAWFQRHEAAYLSELLALRAFVPRSGLGVEIGVGSGRFAAPLGIRVGVDPSPRMLAIAAARGIEVVEGAESVFYREATFFAAEDVERLLGPAGLAVSAWGQTLSRPLEEIRDVEPLQPGRGRCAFVVVSARKGQ